MSLNSTPSSERVHIGIFGRRNAGKSSLINALTGQSLAIVSDIAGTTTDPVSKAMELLPLGAVVITDTPGLDDEGVLGSMRVKKAVQSLNKTDIAILAVDAAVGMADEDRKILELIAEKNIPYITVYNKSDVCRIDKTDLGENEIAVSAATGEGISLLKERLARLIPQKKASYPIISDKIKKGDVVVLVVPIDAAAPKGRLILPQQQTIRELLEAGALSVVCREFELADTLKALAKKPAVVITDSQAFHVVSEIVPDDIPLTSFSILFARRKGDLAAAIRGAYALDTLKDGGKILISEGCTHHRQCGDIGTQKLPALIRRHALKQGLKGEFEFEFTSGTEFTDTPEEYDIIIHCGGCMLNEAEMKHRIHVVEKAGVPMTNYGTAIAHMNGILDRSIRIFPEITNTL